ncbi:hypothetical protein EJP82_19505 [Paenibacillus anaericanus]|uniref:Restriction endonuclease type IV Mrr domain-containing protein n=1 Tax=Paenibacillus anaericanus TaxID=170367 RepID=A0A3S1BKK0_9BACL|nr:hypothetical protein EJP82_19505 [Paenibacillus anaericanus]
MLKNKPGTGENCDTYNTGYTCEIKKFERLLSLYFRDQGYVVKEVGVGGKYSGVDLVITDQQGEKTAVQAKCYGDHNNVGGKQFVNWLKLNMIMIVFLA